MSMSLENDSKPPDAAVHEWRYHWRTPLLRIQFTCHLSLPPRSPSSFIFLRPVQDSYTPASSIRHHDHRLGEYNARTYTCPPARRGGHRWQNQVFSSSLRVSLCAFSLPLLYSRPRPVTYKLETDTDICQPAVRDFFVRPVSVLARG